MNGNQLEKFDIASSNPPLLTLLANFNDTICKCKYAYLGKYKRTRQIH